MHKSLYILCEGETDELFYERLAERVTGMSFDLQQEFRARRGANFKTAIKLARLTLDRVKHWSSQQDIAVIIAVDNDRAPGHPGSPPPVRALPKFDQKKQPRYPALKQMVTDKLGADPTAWPVDVALAVPVEMIESWLLLLENPQRPELPLFAEASQSLARQYHGRRPPPQLKDLRHAATRGRNATAEQLFFEMADSGDLGQLAQRSPSYAMFAADLQLWRKPVRARAL